MPWSRDWACHHQGKVSLTFLPQGCQATPESLREQTGLIFLKLLRGSQQDRDPYCPDLLPEEELVLVQHARGKDCVGGTCPDLPRETRLVMGRGVAANQFGECGFCNNLDDVKCLGGLGRPNV